MQSLQSDTNKLIKHENLSQLSVKGGRNYINGIKKDTALTYEVERAFGMENLLHELDYFDLNLQVKDAVAYVSGHVVDTVNQNRIENAIRAVPGILGIKNKLVVDEKLSLEISTSLEKLENTSGSEFFTNVSHGVVSINGTVCNEDVKQIAEQCAANNPNVRGVMNHTHVQGAKLSLPDDTFLQPIVGGVVYFLDGVSGVVKQVIIDPHNRRVVAMTIQGSFSKKILDMKAVANGWPESHKQTILIPMDLIRYLTSSSIFLTIQSTETALFEDFNPLYFTAPHKDWAPPYPYGSEDVLFACKPKKQEDHGGQIVQITKSTG